MCSSTLFDSKLHVVVVNVGDLVSTLTLGLRSENDQILYELSGQFIEKTSLFCD